jgi:hypothetical protein
MHPPAFMVSALLVALLGVTRATSAVAAETPAETAPAKEEDRRARVLLMLEARPWIRPGIVLGHRVSPSLRLEHSLTSGLASFPDLEVRSAADWSPLGPVRPWLSFRTRRIELRDLPPVENHVAFGIGVASDPDKPLSLIGNLGLSFQVPPMSRYASRDFGTYVGENIGVVLLFGVRARVW